jgi:hypothetical protein
MTQEYMDRRAKVAGIKAVYALYRYRITGQAQLAMHAAKYLVKGLCHGVLALARKRMTQQWFRHHFTSVQHFESVAQSARLLRSEELRLHTKQASYL